MARTPAHLAARIDRLSRTAHRFHRFAHHPLCSEYGGEVVRLGKRNRVCRGCLFTAVGGVVGFGASFIARPPSSLHSVLMGGGLAMMMATVLRRRSAGDRAARKRLSKVVSRFLPALAIAYAFGGAVQSGVAGGWLAALSIAPAFAVVIIYRRRGPDRTPCATCIERNRAAPCRGIAPIVRRERAFRRLAGQWLARAGS